MFCVETENQPTFAFAEQVKQIVNPVLQSCGINYFQFLRVHKNGGISWITNNRQFVMERCSLPVHFPFVLLDNKLQSCFVSYTDAMMGLQLTSLSSKHHIYNPIDWYMRQNDFCDVISLGLGAFSTLSSSFYFSNIEKLKSIIHELLLTKLHNISTIIMDNPLLFPDLKMDITPESLCLPLDQKSHTYPILHKSLNFTTQQYRCATAKCKGYSCKEIARLLNLSHRTVEEYLSHARTKINEAGFKGLNDYWNKLPM